MVKLKKDVIELQRQWNNVAKGTNWRGYIAAGNELEEDFDKSGFVWTKHLQDYLFDFNINILGKIMIELGCGAGRMTKFLSYSTKKLYAMDISQGILNKAIERIGSRKNVEFIVSPGDFSFLPEYSIDIIFSVAVFQHANEESVEYYLKDGATTLKQGGYFIFQIPISSQHETIPYENEPAVDMTYWTLGEIKQLAKKYNYYIINIPKDTISNGNEYFIFKKL